MAHHLRRQHPSPKPPQLLAELIRFFTKHNGRVLDPFCGTGSSLLACSMTERRGVGFDLSAQYQALYYEVAQSLQLPTLPYYVGDSSDAATFMQSDIAEFDFVIADPPYLSMLNKKRTGHRAKKGQRQATPFSDNQHDLGNMTTDAFFDTLIRVIQNCTALLREHGHMAIFIKDMQPDAKHHNMLHADVVNALTVIPNIRFRGYRIWHDANVNLFPFGYPHTFVANQTHQFILIYRKETALSHP